MKIPKNQIEFEKMFATEEQCIDFLKEIRFPNGYKFRKCQHEEYWLNKRGIVCKSCKDELSITAGTIFHKSKLPLVTIFRALWWMVAQKNGVSATGLQRVLGIGSYRTAWTWLHKFGIKILWAKNIYLIIWTNIHLDTIEENQKAADFFFKD